VAGPLRKLEFDVLRFEQHIALLATGAPNTVLDLRGNAHGIGHELIKPLLERVGVSVLDLNSDENHAGTSGQDPEQNVVSGDDLFGYTNAGHGFARFSGTVVNVKRVSAGRSISYGYTYTTSADTTLALVNLGYADGAVRRASSLASVRIGEQTGVIAGRIAMDQFVVDLGDVEARPGEEAVLWGDPEKGEPSINEWSKLTGIPALALLSAVGPRVARVPLHRNGGVA
jgi:alanine racemase